MKFHRGAVDEQLTGECLGERHRSLNQLVISSDPQLLTEENLSNWSHRTLADQIYIAKLADRTKNAAVLCEIFKTDNEMVNAVAMHATWLFTGTTNKDLINADNFVNNIFPSATTHTVCRIVSLFSAYLKDEHLAEELFLLMFPLYGHEMSFKLLPVCSTNFIRSHIMDGYKELPSAVLKRIFRKDETLAVQYLQHNIQKNYELKVKNFFLFKKDYVSFWITVAKFQPYFFMSILKKNHFDFKLGWRVTLKIVKSYLNEIIDNPSLYVNILHQPTLIGKLKGDDLERFFLNLLPSKEKEFKYSTLKELFERLKPAFRVKFLMKIYSRKYKGASFLSRKDFNEWDMIEALPADERISWAQNKIDNITHSQQLREDFYLKFVSTDIVVPRIIFLIEYDSLKSKRKDLLKTMIDCCRINNDHDALLTVLKYTSKRYRHDQNDFLLSCLDHLQDSFKLHEMSKEHWDVINEIVGIVMLGNVKYSWVNIFKAQLKYCLANKLEIDSVVQKLLEYNAKIELNGFQPEDEAIVLEAFLRNNRKKYEKCYEHERFFKDIFRTYETRSNINKHAPTECEWLMEAVEEVTGKCHSFVKQLIFTHMSNDAKARKMFSDEIFKADIQKFSQYYLRHDANVIKRNIPELLAHCLKYYKLKYFIRFFRRIRAYFNKPMTEDLLHKIKEHCEKQNIEAMKCVAFALFQDAEQTESDVKKFIPSTTFIPYELHKNERDNGKLITKYFKFFTISFDTVLQFAGHDFLKRTFTRSVMSLAYKKPRRDVVSFITQLLEKPISFKIHGIRLAYFIMPRNELLAIYRRAWDNSYDTENILVKNVFKIMCSPQCNNDELNEIWSVLKHYIESFEEFHVKLFTYLKHEKIPLQLNTDYWTVCCLKLKMLSSKKADVHQIMWHSVAAMTLNMEHLSQEFCLLIVSEYLKSLEELSDEFELYRFVAKYLITLKNKKIQKILVSNVCDALNIYIKQMGYNYNNECKSKEHLTKFVIACCRESLNLELKINPKKLLDVLEEMFSNSLKTGCYDLEVKLDLSIRYVSSVDYVCKQNLSVKDASDFKEYLKCFGRRTCIYIIDNLFKTYDRETAPLFFSTYKDFVYNFLLREVSENKNVFLAAIISNIITFESSNNLLLLLAVDMLPDDLDVEDDCFYRIIRKLIEKGGVCVKMLLDKKVKSKINVYL